MVLENEKVKRKRQSFLLLWRFHVTNNVWAGFPYFIMQSLLFAGQ